MNIQRLHTFWQILLSRTRAPFIWFPVVLQSCILGSVPYLGVSTLFQLIFRQPFESLFLYAAFVALCAVLLVRQSREFWDFTAFRFRWNILFLLGLGLVVVLYRSPIYFHAIDDFVFHMIAGYYAGNLWSGNTFLPMDFGTYPFPLLQTMYYFFIDSIGIRASLFLFNLSKLFWFVHLNLRFRTLLFPQEKKKRIFVDLLFIFLYFLPEITLTHVTFMSDFYSVLFALEVLYLYLRKSSVGWMSIMMMLALFVKQSSGIFLLPLFAYFFFSRVRQIKANDIVLVSAFALPILVFHLATYIFTGNPLSFLLNSIFQSPLYAANNFRDGRWGPQGPLSALTWPVIFFRSSRYIEFWENMRLRAFFASFVALPYMLTIVALIKKRTLLLMIMLFSYVFWAFFSGYGRYHVAMSSVSIILLLWEFRKRLPRISGEIKTAVIIGVFSAICFLSVKNDYALRNFIIQGMRPPTVSPYLFQLYKEGLGLIGKDRYRDIYESTKKSYAGYDAILIHGRGVSTFYAFLANKYENKPVIAALSEKQASAILESPKISPLLKENLNRVNDFQTVLFIFDNNSEQEIGTLRLPDKFACGHLSRNKVVPQFQHPNYFNHVRDMRCTHL